MPCICSLIVIIVLNEIEYSLLLELATHTLFMYVLFPLCIIFHRCVVWTGDERVFFFNPSQNQSVWDCPDELEGRADVKKLMQTPPSLMQSNSRIFLVLILECDIYCNT